MTTDHLDDEPAFRLAGRVVKADIAALNGGIFVSRFSCFTFEDGQKGLGHFLVRIAPFVPSPGKI